MASFAIFASVSLCFLSVAFSSYAHYRLPAGLISQTLADIKALDQEKFSARELAGCMAPLLQKTSVKILNILMSHPWLEGARSRDDAGNRQGFLHRESDKASEFS